MKWLVAALFAAVGSAQLLPFYNATAYDKRDDGTPGNFPLPFSLSFFGVQRPAAAVSNNGVISFSGTFISYTSAAFPLAQARAIVAPFWADVDTRGVVAQTAADPREPNRLYYAIYDLTATPLAADPAAIAARLPVLVAERSYNISFVPRQVVVATWYRVAGFNANTTLGVLNGLNTFQAAVADDVAGNTFAFFFYVEVNWLRGAGWTADPAAGFDAGNGVGADPSTYYNLPGSRTAAGALAWPTLNNGIFVYLISNTTIVEYAPTPTPTASASATPSITPTRTPSRSFSSTATATATRALSLIGSFEIVLDVEFGISNPGLQTSAGLARCAVFTAAGLPTNITAIVDAQTSQTFMPTNAGAACGGRRLRRTHSTRQLQAETTSVVIFQFAIQTSDPATTRAALIAALGAEPQRSIALQPLLDQLGALYGGNAVAGALNLPGVYYAAPAPINFQAVMITTPLAAALLAALGAFAVWICRRKRPAAQRDEGHFEGVNPMRYKADIA